MGSITLSLVFSLIMKPRQQQQHIYGGPEDPFARGAVAPHPGYHNPQPVYTQQQQQYGGRPPPPGRAPLTTPVWNTEHALACRVDG